jgi:hypothetical protein
MFVSSQFLKSARRRGSPWFQKLIAGLARYGAGFVLLRTCCFL